VPQQLVGQGRTFLSREWNIATLAKAVHYVESGKLARWVELGRPGMDRVRLVNAVDAVGRGDRESVHR
jgi:hypothetical protein